MRAILINPEAKSITEVDYNGDYTNIYDHIGASCFDGVWIGDRERHTLYVDDNGLNNGAALRVGMFRYDGENPAYLAGKALILATDAEGESVAATMTLDDVRAKVAFGKPARVGDMLLFMELGFNGKTGRFWPIDN